MGFQIMANLIGTASGREECFEESIYLLDEQYRILGMRRATRTTGPLAKIGDLFFEQFPATKQELTTLSGLTRLFAPRSLLLRAGKRPVLMITNLFARSRMLLAVVPEQPVREFLEHTAQYEETLELYHLLLSPESVRRRKEPSEQAYRSLTSFVKRIQETVFYDRIQYLEPNASLLNAVMRLSRIATLCGCSAEYDFTAVEHITKNHSDPDLLTESLFPLFLAVQRTSKSKRVTLIAEPAYGCGPVVGALFDCGVPVNELYEFIPLQAEATLRGERFEITPHPREAGHVIVQFALCHKEISDQGIKHPLPKCFSENSLPLSIRIPDEVFEEANSKLQ